MCPLKLMLPVYYLLTVVNVCVAEVSGSHDRGQGYSYVYIGDTLQLNCTLYESSSWEAEDLLFFLDTESCENELCGKITSDLQVINNRTLQMNRFISSSKDGGEYECFVMTPQGKPKPVDSHKVYVQYRPQEVQNIFCEVYDWDSNLTCYWDFGVEYISNDIEDHSSPAIAVNASVYMQSTLGTARKDPCPRGQTQAQDKDPMRMCVWAEQHFFASSRYVLEVIVINTITKDNKTMRQYFLTSKIAL
ncbi:uncharacterized protein [Littorina saxatilis]|uniref:uncharacterized protein n=1 Tax=Littorina saxatilis TaxID=31220 RepID=UPI0038B48501